MRSERKGKGKGESQKVNWCALFQLVDRHSPCLDTLARLEVRASFSSRLILN